MTRHYVQTGLSITPKLLDRIEKDREGEDITRSRFIEGIIRKYYEILDQNGTIHTLVTVGGSTS